MDCILETRFFLGANTIKGKHWVSLDQESDTVSYRLILLSAGTLKDRSHILHILADQALSLGEPTQHIYSSLFPQLLEGLFFTRLKLGLVNADAVSKTTSFIPLCQYLDLSDLYDYDTLVKESPELAHLHRIHKDQLSRAYDCLFASEIISPHKIPGIFSDYKVETIYKRLKGTITRELGKMPATVQKPRVTTRFLSAFTPDGTVFFEDSLKSVCQRIYTLDNDMGLAFIYLEKLELSASNYGYELIRCPDPICPNRLEALLIPELSLGFLAISSVRGFQGESYRHIRLDALIPPQSIRKYRSRIRRLAKLRLELMQDAQFCLAEACETEHKIFDIYSRSLSLHRLENIASTQIDKLNRLSKGG